MLSTPGAIYKQADVKADRGTIAGNPTIYSASPDRRATFRYWAPAPVRAARSLRPHGTSAGSGYIDELVQIGVNDDPADTSEGDGTQTRTEASYWAMQGVNYHVLGLLDSGGGLVERYEYSPYRKRTVYKSAGSNDPDAQSPTAMSQRWSNTGSGGPGEPGSSHPFGLNPFGHQGLPHDAETGLIYNRNRMLHTTLGRFVQRDPLGYVDGMNRYQYVRNSPVNWVDSFGLYGSAGHFYTPYILGRAAGWSRADAFEFAYWSQYPDEDPRYSAMGSRTAGLPLGMSEDINRAIHQLNDSPAGPQRDLLECLLERFEEPWQRGLINHAFGDAFSHTEPGTGETYGTLFGHAFDGHQPDYIGNRPDLYGQYAQRLGDVLGVPEDDPVYDLLDNTAEGAPTFDHAAEAISFWAQAQVRYGYEQNWWRPEVQGLDQVTVPEGANIGRLTRDQVRQFLDELRDITLEDCCEQ